MQKRKKLFAAVCMAAFFATNLLSAGLSVQANEIPDEIATYSDADYKVEHDSDNEAENATEDAEQTEQLIEETETVVEEGAESISVSVHQQTYGFLPTVSSGETAGNVNTGKRLEGLTIVRTTQGEKLAGSILYRAHCQSIGWQEWKNEGQLAGTNGQAKRLEAVQIKLTGELEKQYDICYRVYMSNCGWLGWTKNGEIAGTVGYAATLEGIQVILAKKDSEYSVRPEKYASITEETMNDISYSGHVQTYGNTQTYKNGQMLGTTGQGKRLEAISIRLSHNAQEMFGTIKYRVHCQTYGWQDTVSEGTLAGTTGQAKRMEAISISLSGDISKYCDVYYRVHCQKHGWLGWAKNGDYAGTEGNGYRMEAIEIRLLPKGSKAPGSMENAFTTKRVISTTSGYAMLEPYLDAILAKCTNPSMTQEQKLRACYDYVRTSFTYRTLSDACPSNFKWYEYYTYQLVTTGSGNCFGFNSLLGELALKIGYTDVHFYKGSCFPRRYRHGFITINGLFYDPELHFKGTPVYGCTNGNPVPYYIDIMD